MRDCGQPLGSVVDGVHACQNSEQDLRRADIAGGLLTTNVLLARLQREAIRGTSIEIHTHANKAPRKGALQA